MFFKTIEYLKDIQNYINNSYKLPIFKGYRAVNKRGVVKLIDEIYASLPEDVQIARQYLHENNQEISKTSNEPENTYNLLKMIEIYLDEGLQFIDSVIIKSKEMDHLLERLNASLPQEIQQAEKMNK